MNNTKTNKTTEKTTAKKINEQELSLEQLEMVNGGGFLESLISFITHATTFGD